MRLERHACSMWYRLSPLVCLAAALAVLGFGAGQSAAASSPGHACRLGAANTLEAVECARLRAVPSLQPAATTRLWRKLVRARRTGALSATADCRPLRAIFYTASDWMRLATKLAASGSPCAQYYISIPPLAEDKTQARTDQAWRIRALGPSFHALDEINMSAWGTWLADNGGTWYQAGVEARRRMAAAGYDVSLGDSWAVNEFSSAVRRGDATARADARDFVHGLFDGDGTTPKTRGTVFIVGMGQGTLDLSTYKTNVENWLLDTAFWTDMSAYVSDWAQEVYGDFRNYGVAGSSLATRRDYLNDFLEHKIVLAGVGPDTIATARSFLQTAYSPLANAAWQWSTGFGYTTISADQMENYVSAQTYALRYFSATTAQSQDHWGFAWAPNNSTGITSTDFTTQTAAILDRLATAIHDSAQTVDATDPGVGACGPLGQNLWCAGEITGAWFNDAWKTFRYWAQPTLAFATASQTLTAGSPSAPMTVQLRTSSGAPQAASSAVTVSVSSSSAQGTFSTSTSGPWTSTLSLTIAAGSTTSPSFYYADTRAGSPTLTASAAGATSGTQTETVNPGPLASVSLSPSSASVPVGGTQAFTAGGADAYGNAVTITSANWSVSAGTPGTVSPTTGNPTTFTASSTTGSGTVVATVATATSSLSGSASVTVVSAPTVNVSSITYAIGGSLKQRLMVTVALVDGRGNPVAGASVSISLYRNGSLSYTGTGTTGPDGKVTFKLTNAPAGCYTTTVTNVTASGLTWDGTTPQNQFCK